MTDSLARALVRELTGDAPARAEAATRAKAALCLVDYLSCVFAGRQLPYAKQAIAAMRPWSFAAGIPVPATHLRLAPGEAAYLASLLAASASRTDMHPASTSHPAAVVFPVAITCAGIVPVDGAAFVAAVIAGYEAMGRLGRIVVDDAFKKRFRATSVLGPVGGAIVASRLLRLTEDQAVSAVALAANHAAGLMAWGHTGEVDLFHQPANAARAAITSALLAREGASASEAIFESPGGYFAAFGGLDRAAGLRRRAVPGWEIDLIDYKPVPACVFVQAAAFATRKLVQEHAIPGDAIEGVRLRTFASAIAYPGCDNAGPIAASQPARMSLQYTVASVLARRGLTDRNYADVGDPLTDRLASAVAVEEGAEFTSAFPKRQGAEVEVRTRDGGVHRARIDEVPDVLPARVRERFHEAGATLYPQDTLAAMEAACLGCGALDDVRALLDKTPIGIPQEDTR